LNKFILFYKDRVGEIIEYKILLKIFRKSFSINFIKIGDEYRFEIIFYNYQKDFNWWYSKPNPIKDIKRTIGMLHPSNNNTFLSKYMRKILKKNLK
jgi:hypothetical protein